MMEVPKDINSLFHQVNRPGRVGITRERSDKYSRPWLVKFRDVSVSTASFKAAIREKDLILREEFNK